MTIDYEGLKISKATAIQNAAKGIERRRTGNDFAERIRNAVGSRYFAIATVGGADISLNLYSTTLYAGIE